jgi:surface antigen
MFSRLVGLFAAISLMIASAAPAAVQDFSSQAWQCAPFAREFSGIQLFGNAATWWAQAEGRYARGNSPQVGAVLSFQATGRMRAGHVAVVSEVVSERTIRVTHANWSPINGRRGQVEQNVEVVDVSPANDWSQVRVWYAPLGDLGNSSNPTNGFIYRDEPRLVLASIE